MLARSHLTIVRVCGYAKRRSSGAEVCELVFLAELHRQLRPGVKVDHFPVLRDGGRGTAVGVAEGEVELLDPETVNRNHPLEVVMRRVSDSC